VNAKVTQYTSSVNFRYFMSKNFHFQLLSFPKRNRKHMRSPCSIRVCISFNLLSQANSFKEMGINIMPLHPHQEHNLQLPTVSNSNTAHTYTHTPLYNMNFTHSSRGNPRERAWDNEMPDCKPLSSTQRKHKKN